MNTNCLQKSRHGLSLLVLLFLSGLLYGQGFYKTTDWRFSNPKRFGFNVIDLDFFDNTRGIAVGASGGIAYTTDGGTSWNYGPFTFINPAGLQTSTSFADVHFVTATTAYAVGSQGCMAKTTDGGATWSLVTTPLFARSRNINAVWFLDANRGYIGGQWNAVDSIPRLYVTNNGGATWDSLDAPVGGKSVVGFPNNANVGALQWDITAKAKEIVHIQFLNPNVGYITGSSASGGGNFFPRQPNVTSTATCAVNGTVGTSAGDASLVWKFQNGTLIDYSVSKERLGYNGIFNAAPSCTYRYASNSVHTQTLRALHIINDSTILAIAQNNNIVIKIHTGVADSTPNINIPGLYEKGRYQLLNAPTPPVNNNTGIGPSIPAVNPAFAFSQPRSIVKAPNGKLLVPVNSPVIAPVNRMLTSTDTGRTWVEERWLPSGRNYSEFGGTTMDILPSGKFVAAGLNGVVSDSTPGGAWSSSYVQYATRTFNKIDFADCNNGLAAGGPAFSVTTDGGKTWVETVRADFANLNISINSGVYAGSNPARAYLATSVGNIYRSDNVNSGAPVVDPVYANSNEQMWDIATAGNDSVWVCGYSAFSVAAASRSPKIFRSVDGGNNWTVYNGFHTGSNFQNFRVIEFPTRLVGYVAGTRDTVWKTTDGGVSWSKLPLPTPGVTPQLTYNDMFALDANTVFLVGNGFPRKVVFRTTDGGATWQDITGNIAAIYPVGNLNSVVFHDLNNGYVAGPGGAMLITNDGGATWRLSIPPSNNNNTSLAFAPKKVPAGIPFANRKLFLVGIFSNHILEYGDTANVNVNTTETIVNASCTSPAGGSITLNASGGLAPYSYSINGGAFQASNVFSGLSQGPKTITIKDAFCGTLTKTITVGFNDNLSLTTSNDTVVCAGAPVPMLAAVNGTGAAFSWSPGGGLSATNISNPVATISQTSAYTVTASLNGCVRARTVNIGIKPNPAINAGPDKTILEGELATLDGSGSANPVFIGWTPANSIIAGVNLYGAVAKPAATTVYTLTVRNTDGCTSTDNATVTVIPYCVKVMNAFTPNGDGTNDRWLVSSSTACYTRMAVAVYNRYGNLVYKNDTYNNDWDGTYKGKPVPDGTYYYSNTYYLIGGKAVTVKGDVTILR